MGGQVRSEGCEGVSEMTQHCLVQEELVWIEVLEVQWNYHVNFPGWSFVIHHLYHCWTVVRCNLKDDRLKGSVYIYSFLYIFK